MITLLVWSVLLSCERRGLLPRLLGLGCLCGVKRGWMEGGGESIGLYEEEGVSYDPVTTNTMVEATRTTNFSETRFCLLGCVILAGGGFFCVRWNERQWLIDSFVRHGRDGH